MDHHQFASCLWNCQRVEVDPQSIGLGGWISKLLRHGAEEWPSPSQSMFSWGRLIDLWRRWAKKKFTHHPGMNWALDTCFWTVFDPQISTLQPAQVVIPFMRIAIPNHQPKLPVSHSLSFCDPIIWSGSTVPNPIPVSSNIPNLPDSLCIIVIWEHNSQ